jgi:hypothetical protein
MSNLSEKGNFIPINKQFINDGKNALSQLSHVQEKYSKTDTDTFINELRDSMIGQILGFQEVNTSKHGFDCKRVDGKFLEVKNASFSAKSWSATFNDTTYEKASLFESNEVFLALAVWDKAADLLFFVFGQNKDIGIYLKTKIDSFKRGETVRSTQTLSFSALITKYNFKIVTITRSKNEVIEIIRKKNRSLGSKLKITDICLPNELF